MKHFESLSLHIPQANAPIAYRAPAPAASPVEYLPFTIRPIRNQADFERALHIRYAAYARHLPEFADALKTPESDDLEHDVTIFLATSKVDGSTLGSARIQNNLRRPLNLEQSVQLPDWLKGKRLAEARRLSVAPGSAGRLVKHALIKACLLYSIEHRLQWSVLAARPPLDRMYEKLLFRDLLNGETFIPLPRANNVPHRVLGLDMEQLEANYTQAGHPLLDFFCHTHHPDIQIDGHRDMSVRWMQTIGSPGVMRTETMEQTARL